MCDRYNIPLIEDAAEALGALYQGKAVGTFGMAGFYSFNGNKIITTSSGGMVVSDDIELVEKIRFWATQSRNKELHYEHSEVGYNYRMSNVLAAIGRGQLMVLPDRIKEEKGNLSPLSRIGWQNYLDWNSCLSLISGALVDGLLV